MMKMKVLFILLTLPTIYTARGLSNPEFCDVRRWYLTLIADDVFNKDLTPEMLQLKQSIETMVLNSANDKKTDCNALKMYNIMLKDKFDYDHGRKDLNIKAPDTSDENESIHESHKDDESNGQELDVTVNDDSGGTKAINLEQKQNENIQQVHEKKGSKEDDDEHIQHFEVKPDSDIEEDQTDIDETDFLGDEDIDEGIDSFVSDNTETNFETAPDNNNVWSELDTDEIFITKSIPVGVCVSFGCLQSDIFNVYNIGDIYSDVKDEKTYDISNSEIHRQISEAERELKHTIPGTVEDFQNVCVSELYTCSNKCHYMFSSKYCIIGHVVQSDIKELKEENIINDIVDNEENKHEKQQLLVEDNMDSVEPHDDGNHMIDENMLNSVHSQSNSVSNTDQMIDNSDKSSNVNDFESFPQETKFGLKKKVRTVYDDTGQTTQNNVKETMKEIEKEHANLFEDMNDITNRLDELETMSKSSETDTEDDSTVQSKHSVDDFEKMLQQTTRQYAQKIQTLELMIMKLENQLLVEKLNKQNHSSTITRLENLILKLENDFLKLNTQYDDMKAENENISKKQNHYLELAYKNKQQACKQLQLPDKSAKTSELLSQHQSKITELTDILRNQSSIIQIIKDRYSTLEDQNRMLHQMIMNQTIFMTSIIQTMQDLSSQNSKNKEEIEALKEKLAEKFDSSETNPGKELIQDNIIATLDRYAADKEISITGSMSNEEDDKSETRDDDVDLNLKLYLEHKSTEEIISNWCPTWNDSCPSCLYRNILSINCVPFRRLFWESCSKDCVKEQSNQHNRKENESSYISNSDSNSNDHLSLDKESAVKHEEPIHEQNTKKIMVGDEKGVENEEKTNSKTEGNIKQSGIHDNKEHTNSEEIKKQVRNEMTIENTSNNKIEKDPSDTTKSDKLATKNGNSVEKSIANQVQTDKQTKTILENASEGPKLVQDKQKQENVNPNKKEEPKEADNMNKMASKPAAKVRKVPINLVKDKQKHPKDCYDYYMTGNKRDGIFKIKPVGMEKMIEVFCDMKNGGWTVFQRRQDGTMKFFREWENYKKGFGGLYGEHWLGNDNLHFLTNQDYYKIRVDLMDWDKNKKYAIYDYFLIENEDNGYRINIDEYSGDAGDGLSKHHGHKFSTKDVDNDRVVKEFGGSCAIRFNGAGWYYKCYASNLNGKYYKGGKIPDKKFDGVTWKPWTGPNYSLKKVEMKIKPKSAK